MNETAFETIASAASVLKLDFSSEEFAGYAEDRGFSEEAIEAVKSVFSYLKEKKQQTTVMTLLKLSRLPTKEPKTFENFDFSLLKGKDVERLKALPSLSAIYSHRNLAFIGPAGTGKTHLAQAFGYACCQHGLKTYFIKASELRDRFTAAMRTGKTDSCLSGLVRPSCLIIDEIGHCAFDKENTRLFFDLIDRRYNKEGNYNMIFTSNKNPALWREDFDEDVTLLCALDRIFDDATVFKLRGESFRGKKLETISLQTGKVPAIEPLPSAEE
jgi:DNA replication protein DnaC